MGSNSFLEKSTKGANRHDLLLSCRKPGSKFYFYVAAALWVASQRHNHHHSEIYHDSDLKLCIWTQSVIISGATYITLLLAFGCSNAAPYATQISSVINVILCCDSGAAAFWFFWAWLSSRWCLHILQNANQQMKKRPNKQLVDSNTT